MSRGFRHTLRSLETASTSCPHSKRNRGHLGSPGCHAESEESQYVDFTRFLPPAQVKCCIRGQTHQYLCYLPFRDVHLQNSLNGTPPTGHDRELHRTEFLDTAAFRPLCTATRNLSEFAHTKTHHFGDVHLENSLNGTPRRPSRGLFVQCQPPHKIVNSLITIG